MKNLGKQFERDIMGLADIYEEQGILRIRKTDPPMVWVSGRVVMKRNPFLDFVGTWTERAGRAIFFEVKHTAHPKIRIGGKKGSGGVDIVQVSNLIQWKNAGAASFLIWNCGDVGKTLFIDAPELWNIHKTYGRKYLKFDEARALPRCCELRGLLFHEGMVRFY